MLTVRYMECKQAQRETSLRVLNRGLDVTGFLNSLYQWAATLTSSGQNMPFALPIKADKVDQGFQVRTYQPAAASCQAFT